MPPEVGPAADAAVEARAARRARGDDPLHVRCSSHRLDRPGTRVLYGNQVGGFHVTCSHCGAGLARAFEPFGLTPCTCGRELPFEEVVCRPPAAVGWAALVLMDVEEAVTVDPLGWSVVLRRR
ncbi:MAG: hypothetical protein H6734_07780 [Alphaproteobacteria bacterium]|nr:hypothetical protein [Alphaproteobacteria bacterium]